MFWKYNTPSSVQIDALLQQENVSLQDLMEEEELLQECKAQNKKVIDFLIQPEVLEELVLLLVTDPSPDRELQIRFKYANLASELLTCDVPAIVDKVASSSNLLHMLYKFLEKEKPLNPLLASFVSKVFGMLVQRRSEQNWYNYQFTCFQVLDFLKSQGDFVEVAVKHIGTSAVMDLLSKLICGVDNDDQEIKRGIHQWLNECHLIEQLIEKLTPDCDSEEHSSVDQLLCEIVTTGQDTSSNGSDSQANNSQSRLLTTLESKEVINKLMDTLLHEDRNESSVSHVINILLTLLSYKGSHKQSNLPHMNSVESINSDSLDSRSTVLRTILSRLPDLQKILMQPTKLGTLLTAYGMEVERLGSTRLKVVVLIAALIATQDLHVHAEMAALQTLQLLFDLFFKFSLNNFLHSQVTQCVTCILSTPLMGTGLPEGRMEQIDGLNNNPQRLENGGEGMGRLDQQSKEEAERGGDQEEKRGGALEAAKQHPLLCQLFSECNIIQKILECYSEEEELATTEKMLHNKVGFMGHIREIANAIVQSANDDACSELILSEMKKLPNDVITQWEDFALITLAEINLKNKIIPLQSFRDGDMDSMGDLRFVDDFKLTDEDGFKLSDEDVINGSQRLSGQLPSSSDTQGMNVDDCLESRLQKFEEQCSERSEDILEFGAIWKGREKNITFGAMEKAEEDEGEEQEEEENRHSSSEEEEGDFDDEFDALRSTDDKMDVDFASEEWGHWLQTEALNTSNRKEWPDVFDKRGNALSVDTGFNPWQSAPAAETSDNNSWADFGVSPFQGSGDPFAQAETQSGSNFASAFSRSSSSSSSAATSSTPSQPPPGFQANFSNVLFSNQEASGTGGSVAPFQPIDFGQGSIPSRGPESSGDASPTGTTTSPPNQGQQQSAESLRLQRGCDGSKVEEALHQNVVVSQDESDTGGSVSLDPDSPLGAQSDSLHQPGGSKSPVSPGMGQDSLSPGGGGQSPPVADRPEQTAEGGSPTSEGNPCEPVGEPPSFVEEASTVPRE